MSLPKRLYYPLHLAAKELKCSPADLIHFGATANVEICIHISAEIADWDEYGKTDYEIINKNVINKTSARYPVGNYVRVELDSEGGNIYVREIFGLMALDARDLLSFDISPKVPVKTEPLYFPAGNFDRESGIDGSGEICLRDITPVTLADVKDKLFVTKTEIDRINNKGEDFEVKMPAVEFLDSNKTIAKKGQIIPSLLKMVPELSDIDFEEEKVSKIVNIIEALAAQKGIELPDTHIQTWAKYLGRK